MRESDARARYWQEVKDKKKMNVGALGNMVPQLHVHVIARFETDAAWPAPVWGKVAAQPYDEKNLAAVIAQGNDFIRLFIA